MALFIPAGRFQCKLRWRLAGDPEEMISTIGVEPQGATSPGPEPKDVAHGVYASWLAAWGAGSLHSGWSFVGVDVTVGHDPGEDPGDTVSWDEVSQGTANYASVTSNCAMLVKKKTPLAGRHNTGRMFIPGGYVENDAISQTGAIVAGSLATYQLNMNLFYSNLTDAAVGTAPAVPTDLHPLLFHDYEAAVRVVGEARAPTLISSLIVDPVLATQRRRMRH